MALSYEVMKNRNFRHLLATRVCAVFALQSQAVIVGWQLYTITKSAFTLGLIGLTEAIPALLFAMFAGHIVDKSRPHFIFRNCLLVLCLNTLVLLIVAGGYVPLPQSAVVAVIFMAVFFSGLTRSFIMPSSFTLLSRIVPRENIPAASAWMSSGFQLAAITGPAIAGLIYGGYGNAVAWFMPFLFMLTGVVAISTIHAEHRTFTNKNRREPALQSIAAGWRFVIHNRVLLPIMALDMFAVLFGGAVAVLPVFADQVLHTGSEGLGLLRAAPAAGSIVTALYFALKPMKKLRATVLLSVVAGFGFSIIGFGLSDSYAPALIFLALSGAFDAVSMVIRGTMMQLLVPDTMRGRVSSLNSMFIISSNEIGAFESGSMASLLGLVPSILFGGAMSLLVVGVTALFAKDMRTLVVDTTQQKDAAG